MKLDNDIGYLKGVGPKRAEALAGELGIRTWGEMLMHVPFRYMDRSQVIAIRDIQTEEVAVQLIGRIGRPVEHAGKGPKRITASFTDDSGTIELVWFKGLKWIKDSLKPDLPYVLFGKPVAFKGRWSIVHPEMELLEEARLTQGSGLKPVYSSTEKLSAKGLNSNGIARVTRQLIEEVYYDIPENLPDRLLTQYKLMPRPEALRQLHMPSNHDTLQQALRRMKFEELLFLQLQLVKQKLANTMQERGVVFEKVGECFNTFYNHHLPFELTGAQKRVIKEIRADVARGHHMNRLIQGDVGSGKTMVALLAALLAMDNGYQCCLMAPTEILAQQHHKGISDLLRPLHLEVALITGSTPKGEKRKQLERLAAGEIRFVIGTHALIEPTVQFAQLGLCIIDEQHRFGVMQRAALWKKAEVPPHVLVMTATPIPRTLAMTVYGDLDVSIIDELPPGRKPVKTMWKSDSKRAEVFGFMEQEIAKGRQVYVVYPLIEESEAMDYKDLQDGYESLSRRFPLPNYRISIVHGQMKNDARDYEMALFASGATHIMVATTVIEVGVNVPNASVMIIESAERFGLSQLHQLRGRVGRGAEQSYCVLMSGMKVSKEARTRLETMVATNDGFEIAEVDMQLRGPGDIGGTQQSGVVNMKVADLVKDQKILAAAREIALEILDADPSLSTHENLRLREELQRQSARKSDLSRIS